MAIKTGRKEISIDQSVHLYPPAKNLRPKNLHKLDNKEYFGDELRMDCRRDGVSLQAHLSYDLGQPRVA